LGKKSQALRVLTQLTSLLSSNAYLSTQTTAYSLLALAEYIKSYGGSSAMQAEINVNGKEFKTSGNSAINTSDLDFSKGLSGTIKIKNNGKGALYVRIINRGKPAIGAEKEEQENLISEVVYRSMSNEIITPDRIKQGSDFKMEVTVKNSGIAGELQNLALLNYIPSGWEIHNARMDDTEAASKNSIFDYQDIRDDKIMTYFGLKPNESKTFRFSLNAAYAGSYYLPGINIEAMYDNAVFSRKKGSYIKVVN
jgi:hypothetical protein